MLEKEIRDEEELFHNEKLSKRERKELDYKKQVLKLAKERMSISDKPDGYMVRYSFFPTYFILINLFPRCQKIISQKREN
jgi:hypothetical protein